MRHTISKSFRFSQPEDIDRAHVVDHIQATSSHSTRQGCGAWACTWAPDYSFFAWSSGSRFVHLVPWDVVKNCVKNECTGEYRRHTIDCQEYVWSLAFGSGTANLSKTWTRLKVDQCLILATGLQSGRIKLWNCRTGHLLIELLDHKDLVSHIDFAPDGSLHIVSASRDGTLKLWDLNQDGNMYRTLRPECKRVYSCRWSPNKQFIASCGSYKSAMLWGMKDNTMQIVRRLHGHYHDVVSCEFSRDGALLATASYDTRIIIWDPYTGDSVREFGHLFPPPRPIYAGGANDHYVRNVVFAANGVHLASVNDDGYVRFWNINTPEDPEMICENAGSLSCAVSPGGGVLAVGNKAGNITFYAGFQTSPTLLHMCRTKIRRDFPTPLVDHLHLPIKLKEYLKYHDI